MTLARTCRKKIARKKGTATEKKVQFSCFPFPKQFFLGRAIVVYPFSFSAVVVIKLAPRPPFPTYKTKKKGFFHPRHRSPFFLNNNSAKETSKKGKVYVGEILLSFLLFVRAATGPLHTYFSFLTPQFVWKKAWDFPNAIRINK